MIRQKQTTIQPPAAQEAETVARAVLSMVLVVAAATNNGLITHCSCSLYW
jgi:hypothetical protein